MFEEFSKLAADRTNEEKSILDTVDELSTITVIVTCEDALRIFSIPTRLVINDPLLNAVFTHTLLLEKTGAISKRVSALIELFVEVLTEIGAEIKQLKLRHGLMILNSAHRVFATIVVVNDLSAGYGVALKA